jgi:hypothetical protein
LGREGGKLLIQRLQGKRWKTVEKFSVGKGSVFVTGLRLKGKQRLRAVVGSSTSIVWKQPAKRGKLLGNPPTG